MTWYKRYSVYICIHEYVVNKIFLIYLLWICTDNIVIAVLEIESKIETDLKTSDCIKNKRGWVILWCLTTLSITFQLYHGGQFYWRMTPEYPEKTTDLQQVTEKTISHNVAWAGFELIYVSGVMNWLYKLLFNPTTVRSRQ